MLTRRGVFGRAFTALAAFLASKVDWTDSDDEQPVVYRFERLSVRFLPRGHRLSIQFDHDPETGCAIRSSVTYTDQSGAPLVATHSDKTETGFDVVGQEVYWKRLGALWQRGAEFDRDDDGDRFYFRKGKVVMEPAQTEEKSDERE